MRELIAFQTNQKFEKFQIMPDAPELASDGVAWVGAVRNDGAGVTALNDAAIPFCGGTNV